MAVTTERLQYLLENARDDAQASGRTLREQLRFREREVGKLTEKGTLASVGSGAAQQSFGTHDPGNITTMEMADAYRKLINMFDDCFEDGDTDADVVDCMLTSMPPSGFTEAYTDMSQLRCIR